MKERPDSSSAQEPEKRIADTKSDNKAREAVGQTLLDWLHRRTYGEHPERQKEREEAKDSGSEKGGEARRFRRALNFAGTVLRRKEFGQPELVPVEAFAYGDASGSVEEYQDVSGPERNAQEDIVTVPLQSRTEAQEMVVEATSTPQINLLPKRQPEYQNPSPVSVDQVMYERPIEAPLVEPGAVPEQSMEVSEKVSYPPQSVKEILQNRTYETPAVAADRQQPLESPENTQANERAEALARARYEAEQISPDGLQREVEGLAAEDVAMEKAFDLRTEVRDDNVGLQSHTAPTAPSVPPPVYTPLDPSQNQGFVSPSEPQQSASTNPVDNLLHSLRQDDYQKAAATGFLAAALAMACIGLVMLVI